MQSYSTYATGPVTKAPEWHGIIAWDALLNGMTTGLFLVTAMAELVASSVFSPMAIVAYPVALVLLLVDLSCLVLDLGDPLRFHHMLRVFKPSSPMSLGTWCLTIYSLILTVAAALSLLALSGIPFELARKTAVVCGLLPAFGSAAYKGVLLSTNSQPGWRDARWLGGYLTNSAILLGCAELLILSVLMSKTRATAILRTAFVLLLVLNVFPLAMLFANLRPTLVRLFTRGQLYRVGLFAIASGTLIPLCLMLAGDGLLLIVGAVTSFLLGSLVIRYVYVKIPHASPLRV
jgi:Ni/Fe-hydrogenase subunit HybB-like protein